MYIYLFLAGAVISIRSTDIPDVLRGAALNSNWLFETENIEAWPHHSLLIHLYMCAVQWILTQL